MIQPRTVFFGAIAIYAPIASCYPGHVPPELQKRDDYTGLQKFAHNYDALCGPDYGSSAQENINIWYGTNAVPGFDKFMAAYPDDIDQETGAGWLDKLTSIVYTVEHQMDDCDSVHGTCQIGDDDKVCSKYCLELAGNVQCLNEAEALVDCDPNAEGCGVEYFWIMKSIELWHFQIKLFYQHVILENTIVESLDVDGIVNTFGPDSVSPLPNVYGLIGGSLSGTALFFEETVGNIISFGSVLFGIGGLIAASKGKFSGGEGLSPEDLKQELNDGITDCFNQLNDQLNQIVLDVTGFGGGDMRKIPLDALTNTALSKYPIVQLLDQGKLLYTSEQAGGMKEIMAMADQAAADATAQMILHSLAFSFNPILVIWDEWYGRKVDEAQCNWRKDNYRMARWITYGPLKLTFCAELLQKGGGPIPYEDCNCEKTWAHLESTPDNPDCAREPRRLDDAQIDAINDDYKVDLDRVYTNALSCFENDANQDPLTWQMKAGDALPPCYHNIWVAHGSFQPTGSGKVYNPGYWVGLGDEGEFYKPAYMDS